MIDHLHQYARVQKAFCTGFSRMAFSNLREPCK
jgi:hypothetical protein